MDEDTGQWIRRSSDLTSFQPPISKILLGFQPSKVESKSYSQRAFVDGALEEEAFFSLAEDIASAEAEIDAWFKEAGISSTSSRQGLQEWKAEGWHVTQTNMGGPGHSAVSFRHQIKAAVLKHPLSSANRGSPPVRTTSGTIEPDGFLVTVTENKTSAGK